MIKKNVFLTQFSFLMSNIVAMVTEAHILGSSVDSKT